MTEFSWKSCILFTSQHASPLHTIDDLQWGLTRHRGDETLWLGLFLVLSLATRMIIAVLFPSAYHPDETFQYWEQGYRLAFGYGIVPWEYRTGIRSWIVPGFLASIMSVVDYLGGSGVVWRAVIQFILSACSLSIVLTAFFWAKKLSGIGAAILAGFITSIWFELIYFSGKPLTEVMAAATLFP
ncbi:MAG: hypothetical protein K8F25_00345, partial [Fimbriimonadaceae bacterium]|nr:hypothetical protein [Alphaproteobacteria bacterium]